MNPVLIMLILIGAVIAWFGLSTLFRSIGKVVNGLADEAKNAMYDESSDDDSEE